MAKRRSGFGPLLALALIIAAGYAYASPYIAFYRLQSAAKSGDEAGLAQMVDFPSVRASIHQDVTSEVSRRMRGTGPLASLGGAFAGAITSRVTDSFVTPAGIAALSRGLQPNGRKHEDDGEDGGKDEKGPAPVKMHKGYEGLSTFVVRFDDQESGKQRVALVMEREGLGWKLTRVRLGGAEE
jgi:hypothetical protein